MCGNWLLKVRLGLLGVDAPDVSVVGFLCSGKGCGQCADAQQWHTPSLCCVEVGSASI